MSEMDRLRSLQYYFPNASLDDLRRMMAAQQPQAMPPSLKIDPRALSLAAVSSAPELQSANYRRPVTTGSDFIP